MKKNYDNITIFFGFLIVFTCMLTATFVFAKDDDGLLKKSYQIEKKENVNYTEKELTLTNKLSKTVVVNGIATNYELEVVNGNVVQTNLDTGEKEAIYAKGDAAKISEVNYYYYNAAYILIVTEDGTLYSNVYKSSEDKTHFVRIKTNNEIQGLKVVEKTIQFYEYPSVELYGVNIKGDWEKIRI